MTVYFDGEKYDAAMHFVDAKKSWVKTGLVFIPMHTVEQRILAVFPEDLARKLHACHRKVLGFDKVIPFRAGAYPAKG